MLNHPFVQEQALVWARRLVDRKDDTNESRISDMFKLHLPLRQLFETPTIAGLAKVIEQLSLAQATRDGNNEDEDKPHTIATVPPTT